MKIREGFVSNSSSSSFCIYGFEYSDWSKKHKKVWDALKEAVLREKPDIDEDDDFTLGEEIAALLGMEYHSMDSYSHYFGVEWCCIKDGETGLEFKNRIMHRFMDISGLPEEDIKPVIGTHSGEYMS